MAETAWRLVPLRPDQPVPLPAALHAPPSQWPGPQKSYKQQTLLEDYKQFLTPPPPSLAPLQLGPPLPLPAGARAAGRAFIQTTLTPPTPPTPPPLSPLDG